jgi:hypothetical protein
MIHQPLGGAQGQATDIEIQANEILHHKLTLNGYLVSSSLALTSASCMLHSGVATVTLQVMSCLLKACGLLKIVLC